MPIIDNKMELQKRIPEALYELKTLLHLATGGDDKTPVPECQDFYIYVDGAIAQLESYLACFNPNNTEKPQENTHSIDKIKKANPGLFAPFPHIPNRMNEMAMEGLVEFIQSLLDASRLKRDWFDVLTVTDYKVALREAMVLLVKARNPVIEQRPLI